MKFNAYFRVVLSILLVIVFKETFSQEILPEEAQIGALITPGKKITKETLEQYYNIYEQFRAKQKYVEVSNKLKNTSASSKTPKELSTISNLSIPDFSKEIYSLNHIDRKSLSRILNKKRKLIHRNYYIARGEYESQNYLKDIEKQGYTNFTKIEFYGSGSLKQAVAQGSELPATTGIGVYMDKLFEKPTSILGVRRIELGININIVSTVDTIITNLSSNGNVVADSRLYGNYMLIPLNTGRAATAYARTYLDPTSRLANEHNVLSLSGFQVIATASSRQWAYTIPDNNGQPQIGGLTNASALSVRAGIFHEFLPNIPEIRKDISISLGLDFSFRTLLGDAGFENNIQVGKSYKEVFLGTNKGTFYGVEPYLAIRLRNLRAEVSLPYLFNIDSKNPFKSGSGTRVRGLTNGQLVTSISFIGGFPIKLGD